MKSQRVLILGAAGRDFHNFNMHFRDNPQYKVVGFTTTQIRGLPKRIYPAKYAGKLYPKGIHIYPESRLEQLIKNLKVDLVLFSYSDVSHEYVMHFASKVIALGADFMIMGTKSTQVKPKKPVISVCAVRTGCGKSAVARYVSRILKAKNLRVIAIRHPMPYGRLMDGFQRFEDYSDLDKYNVTVEEREEFEPHIKMGNIVYDGLDYEETLRHAEKEADIIVWDGGNNDFPLIKPDLQIVLVDPHRPGDELISHPGESNLRMADVIVISKENTALKKNIDLVERNSRKANPKAKISHGNMQIRITPKVSLRGKKVIVVEDGPTLTHGGMSYGAGTIIAKRMGANIIDPRKYAVGSLKEVFKEFTNMGKVLPAMGYSRKQLTELERTINSAKCDYVVIGTPIDLGRIIKINKPSLNVEYGFSEKADVVKKAVLNLLKRAKV